MLLDIMVITSTYFVLDGTGPFVERYQMPFMFLMPLQALTTMIMPHLKHQGTFQKVDTVNF